MDIKGFNLAYTGKKQQFVDNQGEWAEDMAKAWDISKYFDSIWCHVEGLREVQPNTLYIFCQSHDIHLPYNNITVKNITDCFGKNVTEAEADASLDFFDLPYGLQNEDGYEITLFDFEHKKAGNLHIAQYIKDINVLWLADFSHTKNFARFTKFWELLVKNYLTPIKKDIEAPKVQIMLGADPEFEVINDGCVIMCPTTVVKGNFNDTRLTEKVGTDGARTQIELRPAPSTTPEGLMDNIKVLMEQINHYHISAKGQGYPVGGHIHFGLVKSDNLPHKLPGSGDFLTLLDYFLGVPLIPLSGNARGNYAQLSGYRDQPHGFEYRSLPACVFENPEIARICVKVAHNLATLHYNNKDITINKNVSIEEMVTIAGLTEAEAKYFFNYIANYDPEDYAMNVIDQWVDKYDNPMTIEFYDLWNADIKNKFRTEIRHIKVPLPVKIIFYGISAKKWGLKYTGFPHCKFIKDHGYQMEHPAGCPHPKNGVAFGLPQVERTYATRDGHGVFGMDAMVDAVKKEIHSINWDKVVGKPITSETLGVL